MNFLFQKKYQWSFLCALVFLSAAGLMLLKFHKQKPAKEILGIQEPAQEKIFFGISGEALPEEKSLLRPFAVVVENHPDSRPQSGLSSADIVYETLVEGGITRFLALFQKGEAEEIGPVRSARDYFAEIADEWGAVFAHVGGSNEVIAELKKNQYKNLKDLNEYYNSQYFFRKKAAEPPHNVFTNNQLLSGSALQDNFESAPWKFKVRENTRNLQTSETKLNFSRKGYEVTWHFNPETNSYLRDIYFEPDTDKISGKRIEAKNVVLMFAKVLEVPNDPLLHIDIDLSVGGDMFLLQDGEQKKGKWEKAGGRTRFFYSEGQEVEFNPGQIWIEILPQEKLADFGLK